jgi:lysophospholipase L1-like esterase
MGICALIQACLSRAASVKVFKKHDGLFTRPSDRADIKVAPVPASSKHRYRADISPMKIHSTILALVALFTLPASAQNTALVPAPRDFPTNWMSRHETYVAEAKKGGIDLLFLGDSITDGWRWGNGGSKIWPKLYAPRHAANFGIGYDRIQNVLWRVENGELENIAPKVVVLLIGTNNSGNEDNGQPRNLTPEIIAGVSNLVGQIQFRLPQTKILLLGIFPRGEKSDPVREQVKAVNAGLAKIADGDKVKFLDLGEKFLAPDGTLSRGLFPDLLHPNEKGYQIWADAMEPTLAEMLK